MSFSGLGSDHFVLTDTSRQWEENPGDDVENFTSQVHVKVATRAGGHRNQDRYLVGDGYAAVLDGASSFARRQPQLDGEWYAEKLTEALERHLSHRAHEDTAQIVARSIADVAQLHGGHEAACPTCTLALTRWDEKTAEVYVLGDSTVSVIGLHGEQNHTDTRLDDIAPDIHRQVRGRLAAGHGFDGPHRELLAELQREQAHARNTRDGYWIAGADSEAAHHAYRRTYRREEVELLALATDGAASIMGTYELYPNWRAFALAEPEFSLQRAVEVEAQDPLATRWPRSKVHDDKTLLIVRLG